MHVREHPTTELNLPGNPWSFETKILLCSQEGLELLAHLRLLPEQCVCYRGVNPPWHQGGLLCMFMGSLVRGKVLYAYTNTKNPTHIFRLYPFLLSAILSIVSIFQLSVFLERNGRREENVYFTF